jgi:tetratricopeptide (TPR) repeat protein
MRTLAPVLGLVFLLAGLVPAPAHADDDEITPAERQLQLAREDFAKGDFARAIQASDSALRLDSGMKEAFKIKGLALEQLGEREDARAMLKAYQTLNSGLPDDPQVLDALERLDRPAVHPLPILLLGAGSGLVVVGFVLHGTAFDSGKQFTDTPQPISRFAEYEALYNRNIAGLALGVAGSALVGVGVGLFVVQLVDGPSAFATGPMPYLSAGPGGVAVGIGGRW